MCHWGSQQRQARVVAESVSLSITEAETVVLVFSLVRITRPHSCLNKKRINAKGLKFQNQLLQRAETLRIYSLSANFMSLILSSFLFPLCLFPIFFLFFTSLTAASDGIRIGVGWGCDDGRGGQGDQRCEVRLISNS